MSAFELTPTTESEPNQVDGLIRLEQLKYEIATCASIDHARDIRDKAEALRVYTKAAGHGLEMQNHCAEVKLRAERRAGELLAGMEKAKRHVNSVKITELGIDHNQSSRWQRIALLPDPEFENYISESNSKGKEITTAGAVRLAKNHLNQKRNSEIVADTNACKIEDLHEAVESGKRFQTIYADPPWQYGNQATRAATDNHYPTMNVDEICELPIAELSDERALLWLWTTNGFLVDALTKVIPAWGFEFKSTLLWCKPQMGIGNYVRVSHEFLLIASKGGLRPDGKSQMSWEEHEEPSCEYVVMDRSKHSKKPHRFREIVENISPGPRIELFGREARPRWSVWGNEISREQFLNWDGA